MDCSWKQLRIKTFIQGEKRKYNRDNVAPLYNKLGLTFRRLWIFLVKKVCPSGSLFYQSNFMNSHYIRKHYIFAMAGLLRILLHVVIMANSLQLNNCYLVHCGGGVPSIRHNEICKINASLHATTCQ